MLNKFLIASCLFFIYVKIGCGQIYINSIEADGSEISDTTSFRVAKIEIIGNEKTRPEVISRELLFAENEIVSFQKITAAYKRVQSLALFNRVKFDLIGDEEYSTLLITVYERWYVFPIPLVYLNERSWSKISYGGKLLYYNFLGKNILLNFTAAFGYNPQFKFAYYNPWFLGRLKLFTNFMIYQGKVASRSPQLADYEDKRKGIDWLLGKRLGHYSYLGITLSYIELSAPPEIGLTLSPTGRDYLPSALFSYQFDDRDLKEYPHKGWNLLLWGKRTGNSHWIHYYRYGIDARTYVPVTRQMTLALRGATDLSSGAIPSYDRVYFGYIERIRGRFYDIREGENLAFGGIELRFPVLKIRYIDIEPMPGLEAYSSNLKFGISAGIFFDTGAVWFQNQALAPTDFRSGFGAGIHFHVPYVDVFRVECGLTNKWKPQFIAEIEVAY